MIFKVGGGNQTIFEGVLVLIVTAILEKRNSVLDTKLPFASSYASKLGRKL